MTPNQFAIVWIIFIVILSGLSLANCAYKKKNRCYPHMDCYQPKKIYIKR